ncbi:MAG: hypothetical protein ACPGC5_04710 [Flavobacteriaceae bacterium]
MVQGLLILLAVFMVVGLINWFSLRMMKVAEAKKAKWRKFFWYIYGIIFFFSGLLNWMGNTEFHWVYASQVLFGLTTIVFNFLGKIETHLE